MKGIKMQKYEREDRVIFQFRNKDVNEELTNRGGATAIYDPVTKRVAFSFCNKLDQFNRKRGIHICNARLDKEKNYYSLQDCDNEIEKVKEAIQEIYQQKTSSWLTVTRKKLCNTKKGKMCKI